MSYKINNGFKFKTASKEAALALIEEWKPELAKLHRGWLAKLHADMVVTMIDEAVTSPGRHVGKVPLDAVRGEIIDRQEKMDSSSLRDPEIDPDFRIAVYDHDTGTYGLVVTERGDWFDAWLRTECVEEFAYWNGSDRPETVTGEEWERRRTIWFDIIKSGQSEAVECADRTLDVTNQEIVAARPNFVARLNRTARRLAQSREFARRELESRPEDVESDQDRFDRLISISCDLTGWVNKEGQSAVAYAATRATEVLLPDIDEDDMTSAIAAVTPGQSIIVGPKAS